MNNKLLKTLCAGLLLFSYAEAYAQQQSYISMSEALNIAERNNADIKMADIETSVSVEEYRRTDAVYLPQVSVGYNAMVTNNPLNAFGFLLQQSRVTMQDFEPGRLNSPGGSHNYAASFDIRMPLLNLDMIYARKGAKLQNDVYENKARFTKEYIKFEVRKAYTQLQFAYNAKSVLEKTLQDLNSISQSVNNFYEEGLLHKSDVLNAQVQVNTIESALEKAKSSIKNASDGLRLLMGMQNAKDSEVYFTDSLVKLSYEHSLAGLSMTRPDILAMQKAVEAADAMTKSAKMNLLPKINAFGSYQFNDKKIFGFKSDSYLAGISMNWNLFSGNTDKHNIKAAKLRKEKLEEQLEQHISKSRMEVDKAERDLNDLDAEIKKHNVSIEQSEEALRILNDRYKEGLVSTTDVLASQAQLSQKRLALAQAVMEYNITAYYKDLLTTSN